MCVGGVCVGDTVGGVIIWDSGCRLTWMSGGILLCG